MKRAESRNIRDITITLRRQAILARKNEDGKKPKPYLKIHFKQFHRQIWHITLHRTRYLRIRLECENILMFTVRYTVRSVYDYTYMAAVTRSRQWPCKMTLKCNLAKTIIYQLQQSGCVISIQASLTIFEQMIQCNLSCSSRFFVGCPFLRASNRYYLNPLARTFSLAHFGFIRLHRLNFQILFGLYRYMHTKHVAVAFFHTYTRDGRKKEVYHKCL